MALHVGNWTEGVDAEIPSPARMYDALLGGWHNFEVDRRAAVMATAKVPDLPKVALSNRAFLRRSVRFLVDAGIRQFLDIGSGIPTAGNYGNGVDLDKLAPVAKHRDAQQGARRVVVAEPGAHHVPGCDEVRLVSARNVDGRPHDVCQHSPCRLQRHLKIVHDLPGLPGDVTERYNPVVLVDRTRAGGVHKPGTGGNYRGVGIRDSIGQAAGTDQFHRHDADDATSAARHTTEFTAASAMRTLQIDRPIPPSLAALYTDHQAVDPIAKAALVLTHFEHQYLPC